MSQQVAICTKGRQSHIVSDLDSSKSVCGKDVSRVVGNVGDVVRHQPAVTLTRYDGTVFTTEPYDVTEHASCLVCHRHERTA